MRAHIDGGRAIDADAYLSLLDEADAMRRAFEHALRPYDAALTPAAPGGAPEGLDFTGSRTQTMLWTMLGVPAINVPALKPWAACRSACRWWGGSGPTRRRCARRPGAPPACRKRASERTIEHAYEHDMTPGRGE